MDNALLTCRKGECHRDSADGGQAPERPLHEAQLARASPCRSPASWIEGQTTLREVGKLAVTSLTPLLPTETSPSPPVQTGWAPDRPPQWPWRCALRGRAVEAGQLLAACTPRACRPGPPRGGAQPLGLPCWEGAQAARRGHVFLLSSRLSLPSWGSRHRGTETDKPPCAPCPSSLQ